MSRRASQPQTRRHIFVFDEDWEFMDRMYGVGSPSKIGTGRAIRAIIHTYVRNVKAKTQGEIDVAVREMENVES